MINHSAKILSNNKISSPPAFEWYVKRDDNNKYYIGNFVNKVECQGDYEALRSFKNLMKTPCLV